MEELEKTLYTGYYRDIMTPPLGIQIPGHGLKERLSEGIATEVYLTAVAFSDGENKAVLFNCDALGITCEGYKEVSQKVAERCQIPAEAVYIACTHCHTSCFISDTAGDQKSADNIFQRRLHRAFCDAAQLAFEDLKPTKIRVARGEVKNVGFIRRYRMKDGTLVTNPATGDPNLLERDGVQDESLQLVRLVREGAKEIVLVNFGTHPDVINGKKYHHDWPGYVVDFVKRALFDEAEVVMLNGASGDSNHIDRFLPKELHHKGDEQAQIMARKITGEVMKIYDYAKEIPAAKVSFGVEVGQVGKNPYKPEEVPIAEKICQSVRETGAIAAELLVHKMSYKKAARILNNLKKPETLPVEIYGLQVGNLAFIGVPGEPFCEIGMDIKKNSPMEMTIVTCRTNGSRGYFPTARAYEGDGYERDYSAYGPDCADVIEKTAASVLGKMEKLPEPTPEEPAK